MDAQDTSHNNTALAYLPTTLQGWAVRLQYNILKSANGPSRISQCTEKAPCRAHVIFAKIC